MSRRTVCGGSFCWSNQEQHTEASRGCLHAPSNLGIASLHSFVFRICCLPPVRNCQQGQALRELSIPNGPGGSGGPRDARSNACRQQHTTTGVPSASHYMIMWHSPISKPAAFSSVARGAKQVCAATPNDASSSSPEALFQPPSGDHENLRAASQQVGDTSKRHREPSSPTSAVPGSSPEQARPSRAAAAQPDRAHFKPGEVLKQSSKRPVRRRNSKEVVIDVTGEAVPDDSSRQVCYHFMYRLVTFAMFGCMHELL